jgi:cellulose synthase/poly-beta-1,6-N-acetylglucosamine synthase-like glycosyltransferase
MQAIASNIMQVIGPVHQVVQNTRNYSGKPPKRIVAGEFPHVTIQMPVYKEGLNAVIKPTVMSLKQAISTYELQGGTANIFINDDGMQIISEEEATKRRDFYAEHDIGWVARPKHNPPPPLKKRGADFDPANHFTRKGKFKKASNMNFALMVSNKVEEKLQHVERHETWSKWDEKDAYDLCFASVLKELNGVAWAEGNIRMGDYILIVDSDTRVPSDCLLDAASEMEQSPEIAIMQFTSGVMKVTTSFFESGITFFTDLVYTAIRYAVASGDVCPFVGHNAILRWSAIQQIGYTDEDGYEKFWSESHVSEDFDMALRLQTIGYSLRLAAYQGEGFKEGVSLTVYDELARWEKYAYGCNELLFHPLRFWPVRGPFTPLFKRFVTSTMPIGAKLTIMAYIGTYYAIGSAWILTLANYFLMGWYLEYIDKFYLDSFAILFAIIVIFNGLTNVTLAVLRYRTGDRGLMESLWENFKWVPLLSIFLSGLSLHVSQALLSHMLEIDMSWGATAKEVEDTSFFQELPKLIKKFRGTFVFSFGCFVLLVVCAVAVPEAWRIQSLVAVYPLGSIAVGHLLLPVVLNPALMMFTW